MKTLTAQQLTWEQLLAEEHKQPYFQAAMNFVIKERAVGKIIYPEQNDIFNALKYTPFDQIEAVIIGQDPYHNPNQAHGLSFSVKPGVPKPPSLRNILKEWHDDLGFTIPKDGSLTPWAKNGILLLNTILTVEAGKPLSHAKIGWQRYTDKIIQLINDHLEGIVFLLWGAPAQLKGAHINASRHHILTAAHPSPLSAHRGFLGCRHFSKTNELLRKMGKKEIDWRL